MMSDTLIVIKNKLYEKFKYYRNAVKRCIQYDNWVQKKFSDYDFEIVENEGNGDCFFASIRDAFHIHRRKITVRQLRQIVSDSATEDVFLQHKYIYDAIRSEKDTDYELLQEYRFMKGIETLQQFKDVILTNLFWANTWAVSTIERVLKTKIIILQKEYHSGILCGQLNDDISTFNPEFYILLNYHQNIHYNLVTYKSRGLFTFKNLPLIIKLVIIDTCMVSDAGPYFVIPSFREMKQSVKKYREEYEIFYLRQCSEKLKKIIYRFI